MIVYVLSRYWDTPANEGNEVMGVYQKQEDAIFDMRKDAAIAKGYYSYDFWEDDMTWEDETEIHLGRCSQSGCNLATIYAWKIDEMEVQ